MGHAAVHACTEPRACALPAASALRLGLGWLASTHQWKEPTHHTAHPLRPASRSAARRPSNCTVSPLRGWQESNPGRGLPALSPEELAMMRSGAAELRRLRRMGTKLAKHKPLEREVGLLACLLACLSSQSVSQPETGPHRLARLRRGGRGGAGWTLRGWWVRICLGGGGGVVWVGW